MVRESAAALLLVHNHPSGDPTPSREDREITARLKEAGELMGCGFSITSLSAPRVTSVSPILACCSGCPAVSERARVTTLRIARDREGSPVSFSFSQFIWTAVDDTDKALALFRLLPAFA
ncbi:MAG: JAB domain-containing protein [Syntrophotaleaceae bacterium]